MNAPPTDGALEARALTLGYAGRAENVVEELSLSLRPGELVGLIGPNGSGKSTAIKALVGVLSPRSGQITLGATPIDAVPRRTFAQAVAYVPQRLQGAAPPFTLLELALQGRHPHRTSLFDTTDDLQRAEAALRQTSVWELRQRRLHEVSGGEAQRALIAAALCQEPRWLLLDEPTSALDMHFATRLFQLLASLRERSGILVATHDLNLASLFCDRLVLIHKGRVHAEGPPAEVLTEPILSAVYGPELRVLAHPDAPNRPVIIPTASHAGSAP